MNLLSRVLPPSDDARGFLRIDDKAKRMQLDVHALSIPDVKLIKTQRISDARGCFARPFSERTLPSEGSITIFSRTISRALIGRERFAGCTFQRPPFAQTKLVRVLRGRIFDVAVDLRRSSPSSGGILPRS